MKHLIFLALYGALITTACYKITDNDIGSNIDKINSGRDTSISEKDTVKSGKDTLVIIKHPKTDSSKPTLIKNGIYRSKISSPPSHVHIGTDTAYRDIIVDDSILRYEYLQPPYSDSQKMYAVYHLMSTFDSVLILKLIESNEKGFPDSIAEYISSIDSSSFTLFHLEIYHGNNQGISGLWEKNDANSPGGVDSVFIDVEGIKFSGYTDKRPYQINQDTLTIGTTFGTSFQDIFKCTGEYLFIGNIYNKEKYEKIK